MAEHFAVEGVELVEAFFGVGVFPEFSGVVEEDGGDDDVAVEFWIDIADGVGGAHHLCDVFDEAAAAGVVVFAGGGGAAEAVAHGFEEMGAEFEEAWVGELGAGGGDVLEIGLLFAAEDGVAGHEVGDGGVVVEDTPGEVVGVDAVLVLGPLAVEFEDRFEGEVGGGFVEGVVGPDFEADVTGGVGEDEVAVGFAVLGGAV